MLLLLLRHRGFALGKRGCLLGQCGRFPIEGGVFALYFGLFPVKTAQLPFKACLVAAAVLRCALRLYGGPATFHVGLPGRKISLACSQGGLLAGKLALLAREFALRPRKLHGLRIDVFGLPDHVFIVDQVGLVVLAQPQHRCIRSVQTLGLGKILVAALNHDSATIQQGKAVICMRLGVDVHVGGVEGWRWW